MDASVLLKMIKKYSSHKERMVKRALKRKGKKTTASGAPENEIGDASPTPT